MTAFADPSSLDDHEGFWRMLRPTIIFGILTVLLFFGVLGGWAATAKMTAGAIAHGIVSPESNVKVIQHLEGGIIQTIHVNEGDHVKAGDLLITLSPVGAEATHTTRIQRWLHYIIVRARLEAYTTGATEMVLPPEVLDSTDPEIKTYTESQKGLFQTQRRSLDLKREIAVQQAGQIENEQNALRAQNVGLKQQVDLLNDQLVGSQELLGQQLIPKAQVTELSSNLANYQSQLAANNARIARLGQNIEEVRLSQLQEEQTFMSTISDQLADLDNQIADVQEEIAATSDVLRRTEIRSPVDGRVLNFRNQTVGGVIRAGEPIMDIVPVNDALIIVAMLQPKDIDLVKVGLQARVMLTPFAGPASKPLEGEVIQIAADTTTDDATHASFYEVRVSISAEELAKHGDVYLSPGMPAEVTVVTGERTMLEYLGDPLIRTINNAFVYD